MIEVTLLIIAIAFVSLIVVKEIQDYIFWRRIDKAFENSFKEMNELLKKKLEEVEDKHFYSYCMKTFNTKEK